MASEGAVERGATNDVAWRRAAACSESSCVEVAAVGDGVGVRDSKSPDAAPLVFSRSEWLAFRDGVRRGDFDDL